MAARAAVAGGPVAMADQDCLGSAADAGDIHGRQFPQAARGRGGVRYGYRLLAFRAFALRRLSVRQQRDREVDEDEASEAHQRADNEDRSNDHRIHTEIVGDPGAYSHELAIGLVEAKRPGQIGTAVPAFDVAHARIPATEVRPGAKAAAKSPTEIARAPKAASTLPPIFSNIRIIIPLLFNTRQFIPPVPHSLHEPCQISETADFRQFRSR